MGLLSDPEYGSGKYTLWLRRYHAIASLLCYLGAIIWFVMLGERQFNNETYFSENALLPGLVTNDFKADYSAKTYFNEFFMELQDKYDDTDDMPVPWLVAKMSQLHLEVYTHNFTLKYPMGQGQVFKGTNVYGILRATRTASLEALVVSVPYRPPHSHLKGTAAGIALMLAFIEFARPQKYWAKDIIFLVTQHEQLGMQAWLEAYHGLASDAETFYTSLGTFWKPDSPSLDLSKLIPSFSLTGDHQKCLDPGKLRGRSGAIQAAINLEIEAPDIKYIEVKVEGLNGQLPNLDLVNLAHKLCYKSGIHTSFHNSYSWLKSYQHNEWYDSVWTMINMLTTQVAGVPSGNHGLFHRFNVEAVTLEGWQAGAAGAAGAPRVATLHTANFHRLGAALESILRSLNNLLERFHQSYFFYLLPATGRFVSIAQYMVSLALLCMASLIHALYLWTNIQESHMHEIIHKEKKEDKPIDANKDSENKPKDEKDNDAVKKVPGDQKPKELAAVPGQKLHLSRVVNIGANHLLVHLLGYVVMNSPIIFIKIGSKFGLPSEYSVYYGLLGSSAALAAAAPRAAGWCRVQRRPEEYRLVHVLVLVQLAAACVCLAVHNAAAGLAAAALYTPLALAAGPADYKPGIKSVTCTLVKRAWCAALQPLVFLSLCMMACSRRLFPEDGWLGTIGRGGDAAMQAVMFSIVDSMIYGNWLYNVCTCVLLPIWIILWQILCNRVDSDVPVLQLDKDKKNN